MIESMKGMVRLGLAILLVATLALAVYACRADASIQEDSVFWRPGSMGDGRGCSLVAPWPAPRIETELCR